jgi:hypothetical protein
MKMKQVRFRTCNSWDKNRRYEPIAKPTEAPVKETGTAHPRELYKSVKKNKFNRNK